MSNQFELFELRGSGRVADTYVGHDHLLGSDVAIRQLRTDAAADPRIAESFFNDARFLASLRHHHETILPIYDLDRESNIVVMELMDGSLADLIRSEGCLKPIRVRSVLQQVLRGLKYLHGNGILHGEIRPSKLLYNARGRVKLGCFSKLDPSVMPKPHVEKYAAPEVCNPSLGQVGPMLDLYCLGFSALELLLGEEFDDLFPVVNGRGDIANIGWLRWHGSTEQLPPVKKLVRSAPDDLANLIDSLLAKRVEDRPQNAQMALVQLSQVKEIPVIEGLEGTLDMHPEPEVNVPSPSNPVEMFTDDARSVNLSASKNLAPNADSANLLGSGVGSGPITPHPAKAKSRTKSAAQSGRSQDRLRRERHRKNNTSESMVSRLIKPVIILPILAVLLAVGLGYIFWFQDRLIPPVSFAVATIPKDVSITSGKIELQPTKEGGEVYELTPGSYTLTFSKPGYQDVSQDIQVIVGMEKLSIELEPVVTGVTLTLNPPDASLSIDGKKLVDKPSEGIPHLLEPGDHKIVVSKLGYETLTEMISLASGETKALDLELKPEADESPTLVSISLVGGRGLLKIRVNGGEWKDASGETYSFVLPNAELPVSIPVELSRGGHEIVRSLETKPLLKTRLGEVDVSELFPKNNPDAKTGWRSYFEPIGNDVDEETGLPLLIRSKKTKSLKGSAGPLVMALVTPGSFSFGAQNPSESELQAVDTEMPEPYYISIDEVTVAQYSKFATEKGESVAGDRWRPSDAEQEADYPVVNISYKQAGAFCKWLSTGARLPREEEWEYAAKTLGSTSSEIQTSEAKQLHSIARKESPDRQMHNLLGNAAEWCSDLYKAGVGEDKSVPGVNKYRVTRGGHFLTPKHRLGITRRSNCSNAGAISVGLRPVLFPDAGSEDKN